MSHDKREAKMTNKTTIDALIADPSFVERMKHLAATAPDRHKANIARWKADPRIRAALAKSQETKK